MKKVKHISWICFDCAKLAEARVPEGHCYTVHTDECSICKQQKEVTEPRDFGITRRNIENMFLKK